LGKAGGSRARFSENKSKSKITKDGYGSSLGGKKKERNSALHAPKTDCKIPTEETGELTQVLAHLWKGMPKDALEGK